MQYKCRNNNVLKRDHVINLVAGLVTMEERYPHRVDFDDPELVIIVEIIRVRGGGAKVINNHLIRVCYDLSIHLCVLSVTIITRSDYTCTYWSIHTLLRMCPHSTPSTPRACCPLSGPVSTCMN